MRGLVALAAEMVALVAVPAGPEAAPSSPKIVYESYADGDFEIYAADPETHAALKLTQSGVIRISNRSPSRRLASAT